MLNTLLTYVLLFLVQLSPQSAGNKDAHELIPGSCTIFSVSCGGSVFLGNNEDWKNPATYCWVRPAGEGEYGVLYFGFDDLGPQGGINEKGLAFDGNALPYARVASHPEKQKATEAIVNNIIMRKCATVEEAISMASSFDWGQLYSNKFAGQYLLADARGDAVVIGFGADGELSFTRKSGNDGYLVSTNFNRANPANRYEPYPCRRFEKASSMLAGVKDGTNCSVEYLASILDAVHEEGGRINTLYSNIYDLRKRIVYVYYWHDFSHAITLDVAGMIASAQKPTPLKDLFPREITEKADAEFRGYEFLPLKIGLGVIWILLVLGSEVLLLTKKLAPYCGTGRTKAFRVLLVLLAGPFGLLFLVARRRLVVATASTADRTS